MPTAMMLVGGREGRGRALARRKGQRGGKMRIEKGHSTIMGQRKKNETALALQEFRSDFIQEKKSGENNVGGRKGTGGGGGGTMKWVNQKSSGANSLFRGTSESLDCGRGKS